MHLEDTETLKERVRITSSLFTGAPQYENFNRFFEIYQSGKIKPPERPCLFDQGTPIDLPKEFEFAGKKFGTENFLEDTETAALLVLHNGKLRHESYRLTGGQDVKWLSMSVAKSIVSSLIGIALDEGSIDSIEQPITDYVPALRDSAYDGVRIKDVLQMSSGARWDENYSDQNSDVVRFAATFGRGDSLDEFTATLVREFEPGTVNRYNSADTQALGMLLRQATGQTITDYTRDKIWQPMGAESEAYWLCDNDGMEMVFGGFNATARDYAKIGELYRQNGFLNNRQIVPASWVGASTIADGDHVQPGNGTPGEFDNVGYGYQWWLPDGDSGEFIAVGVYNQFVYVNPAYNLVVVKLSASRNYAATAGEESKKTLTTIELFRKIAREIT